MISLNDFRSRVKDVARPNRFLVQIVPNPLVFTPVSGGETNTFARVLDIAQSAAAATKVATGDQKSWFFLVKTISLPSRSLGQLEHKRMGFTRKVAGDPTYENLSVTFLNDYGYVARSLIDAWSESIAHQDTNLRQDDRKYADGSFIIVQHLGRNEKPIAMYKFNDVWPVSIEAAELNMDNTDQASEFTVQFSYNTYTKML